VIRPNLLAWQWSDYAAGTLVLAAAALRRSGPRAALAVGCLAVAVLIEFPRFALTGASRRGFRAT
jgi:hypothetical protein